MIERYTDEGHPYRLILSLTSAFDEKRAAPGAGRPALRRGRPRRRRCAGTPRARGGPVNLAWVLMAGVNTGPEEARELARLFAGTSACASPSSTSTTPPAASTAPDDAERGRFLSALAAAAARLRPALLGRPGHPRRLRDAGGQRPGAGMARRSRRLGRLRRVAARASSARAQKVAISACSFDGRVDEGRALQGAAQQPHLAAPRA